MIWIRFAPLGTIVPVKTAPGVCGQAMWAAPLSLTVNVQGLPTRKGPPPLA